MDLFISGHDNVNIYRIPSLIVAPSGTILAIIEREWEMTAIPPI